MWPIIGMHFKKGVIDLLTINVKGQIMSLCECAELVSDSIDVLSVYFSFDNHWNGMTKTAQFTQKNKQTGKYDTYNVVIDSLGIAPIPNEITDGICIISVFGVRGTNRLTTAPIAVPVKKSGFVGDGQTPIPPTPDLYQQLISKIHAAAGVPIIGDNGNWYLNGEDTGIKADWSAEQENAATSAAAAKASEEKAAASALAALTKAPAIDCEVSGSIVSITDAAAQPAVQLISHIEPVQAGSGDPSPDNVRPISGWNKVRVQGTRKNIFNMDTCTAGFYIDDSNGELKSSSLPLLASDWIAIPKDIQQIFISSSQTSGQWGAFYNAQKEYISGILMYNRIFDVPTNAVYMRLTAEQTTKGMLQVEFGNAATAYEPYQGQTLTADLPETVHGGLINWTKGEIVVDRLLTTIGALNVSKLVTDYQTFVISGFPNALFVRSNDVIAISDRFRGLTRETVSANLDNYIWATESQPTQIKVKCTACEAMTADQFKAAYADTQIVYKFAEPYTIQLTSQQLDMLKGTNNVWSDCGDTSVVYVADTKLYIDKKIAAIAAASL